MFGWRYVLYKWALAFGGDVVVAWLATLVRGRRIDVWATLDVVVAVRMVLAMAIQWHGRDDNWLHVHRSASAIVAAFAAAVTVARLGCTEAADAAHVAAEAAAEIVAHCWRTGGLLVEEAWEGVDLCS